MSLSNNPVPAKRGILYMKWGSANDAVLRRSLESVRAIHPELPLHVQELPKTATLLDKSAMMDYSPFEQTLYLDTDTIVLGRLDFGFEMAERHGLACSICECPWARRYAGLKGELVEYNTGVLFFTRKASHLFGEWKKLARIVDSSIIHIHDGKPCLMPCNDQASFSLAQAGSTGSPQAGAATAPFVLPGNWNFRPKWHRGYYGPVKVWHDYADPPADFLQNVRQQAQADAVLQFFTLA